MPASEESLAFPLSGQVAEVFIKRLDTVSSGERLLAIDTGELQQDLALAESTLAIAQSRLAAREAEVARELRRATLQRDISQLDLDFAVRQAGDAT